MALTPQTQHPFHEGTLFQPLFRKRKDTWCDMAHSVVKHQLCVSVMCGVEWHQGQTLLAFGIDG